MITIWKTPIVATVEQVLKDLKYYINPEQAKVRRLMCEGIMARKGSTLIAKELNDAGYRNTVGKPWKPMDIPKFVYDCKNVGTMIINKERHDFESKQTIKLPKEEWVYVENALPPIVTQEEWDLICKIHEERVIATGSDRRGKKTSGYSFSGKLVCGICGAPYWRKQRVSKDEYWVCSTKQTKGRRTRKRDSTMGKAGEINPLGCDNENISYNSLMEIMGVVSERLQANTDTIKQDMINWLTKLRKQLIEANGGHTEADLQRELSRKSKLLDAYLDGILNKQEYMPISNFGSGLQKALSYLPGTYGTSLIKNHMLRGIFEEMENEKLPEEMITAIRETLDCNPQFHGNVVNTTQMVFIMAGSIVVLGAIFLFMTRMPEKENR